mmetsp:Transcript_9227/g.24841  ORF Transcript_9227/g.24841 Transcript_9227/m.24841 type:complete len:289 (+) Transcript_9227:951-1817(+)
MNLRHLRLESWRMLSAHRDKARPILQPSDGLSAKNAAVLKHFHVTCRYIFGGKLGVVDGAERMHAEVALLETALHDGECWRPICGVAVISLLWLANDTPKLAALFVDFLNAVELLAYVHIWRHAIQRGGQRWRDMRCRLIALCDLIVRRWIGRVLLLLLLLRVALEANLWHVKCADAVHVASLVEHLAASCGGRFSRKCPGAAFAGRSADNLVRPADRWAQGTRRIPQRADSTSSVRHWYSRAVLADFAKPRPAAHRISRDVDVVAFCVYRQKTSCTLHNHAAINLLI